MGFYRKKSLLFCIACSLVIGMSGSAYGAFSFSLATERSDFIVEGTEAGEQFGTTMVAADLNGDGVDELIVGSPSFRRGEGISYGKVTVFLSAARGIEERSALFDAKNVLEISGKPGSAFGTALATGDMNGDGLADVAIGAPYAGNGEVYIVFGRKNMKRQRVAVTKFAAAVLEGSSRGSAFGFAVSAADLNADGIADLVVGAPGTNHSGARNAGRVFAFLGRHTWSAKYPKRGTPPYQPNFVVFNERTGERFGSAVYTNDINGDGRADIIVTTPQAASNDMKNAGRVDMFFGGGMSPYTLFVRNTFEADRRVLGDRENMRFGLSFTSGDLDGDGHEEIMISTLDGTIEVIEKSDLERAARSISVRAVRKQTIVAAGESLFFGTALAMFDVDRDGRKDLIIGVPMSKEKDKEGKVIVLFGQTAWPRMRELSEAPEDVVWSGEREGDWFGSVFAKGDFDGDGYQDIAVSAPLGGTARAAGALYGMFGEKSWQARMTERRQGEETVSRGLFVARLFDALQLKERRKKEIDACKENPKLCLFAFSVRSRFSGISFQPFHLYPDVPASHTFADVINTATMLGLVQGGNSELESPFRPDDPIRRMHALKVVVDAVKLLERSGQEEGEQPAVSFSDVQPQDAARAWYVRYVDAALRAGLIDGGKIFRPEEALARFELEEWLHRAIKVMLETS